MDGKTRIILITTMTSLMVLMVTLVATFLNIGGRHDFLFQWTKAYLIGWPIAACAGSLSCCATAAAGTAIRASGTSRTERNIFDSSRATNARMPISIRPVSIHEPYAQITGYCTPARLPLAAPALWEQA